jgi:hypothetical protein
MLDKVKIFILLFSLLFTRRESREADMRERRIVDWLYIMMKLLEAMLCNPPKRLQAAAKRVKAARPCNSSPARKYLADDNTLKMFE